MNLPHDLLQRLVGRFGRVVDLKDNPAVLAAIVEELQQVSHPPPAPSVTGSPFGVSWMDSWVAHWIYDENIKSAATKNRELATALRGLVDLRFAERLAELQLFVRDRLGDVRTPDGGPPDAGPPEPGGGGGGGPRAWGGRELIDEPPDGGTPEPGVPDPPPDPGPSPDPSPGPDAAFPGENPWILYWFVSLKAPQLLRVIDAHFNRRLEELASRVKGRY